MIISRSNFRLALTGAIVLMLVGTLQGCADDVLSPEADVLQAEYEAQAATEADDGCIWVSGVITCT